MRCASNYQIEQINIVSYAQSISDSKYFTPKNCKLAFDAADLYAMGDTEDCQLFAWVSPTRKKVKALNAPIYKELEPTLDKINKTKGIDNFSLFAELSNETIWKNVYEAPIRNKVIKGHSFGDEFICQLFRLINFEESQIEPKKSERYFVLKNAREIFDIVLKDLHDDKVKYYVNLILNSDYFTPQKCKLALGDVKAYAEGGRSYCNFKVNTYISNNNIEDSNKSIYEVIEPLINDVRRRSIDNRGIFSQLNCPEFWEKIHEELKIGGSIKEHSCGDKFIQNVVRYAKRSDLDQSEVVFVLKNAREIFNEVLADLEKNKNTGFIFYLTSLSEKICGVLPYNSC